MISGCGSHIPEIGPSILQRLHESLIAVDLDPGDLTQFPDVLRPAGGVNVDHRIGAKSGQHASIPARVADDTMMVQRIRGGISGTQHLNVEALEQVTWSKLRRVKAGSNLVVDVLSRFAAKLVLNAEDRVQFVGQPHASGRTAK